MAEIALWNNHSFVVSPSVIRGIYDLTIKTGSSTDNKTSSKQVYVKRKNGDAYELSMTVGLSEFTGCDVRNEAMTLLEEARTGKSDYFYIAGVKIVTCKLMLTSASVEEVEMNASATWISCKVKLTFKQSSKMDSTVSTSTTTKKSSSSKNSNSSSNSKNTAYTGSYAEMNASQLTVNTAPITTTSSNNTEKAKEATAAANDKTSALATAVEAVISNAKKTTAAKKSTTTKSQTASKTTTTKDSGGYYAPTGNPFG